ncbi:hypothetical protein GTZ97_12315 [Aquabacterium fontiphilum]|uniref:hypothetical protein n=1 Tax=Aquabacterium fontiphilum TaxID=450365 RepID=UPI001376814E|nr:hypothetical protein [Aquabacterium fontiphilum]NBD21449.1 hypothetical protein [Aquabacterium fontiphilum]
MNTSVRESLPPEPTSVAPSGEAMLAVYGRPVTWKMLVLTAALLLVLMSASAAGIVWWVWHNMAAQVVLHEQQALVRLPETLAVEAAVNQRVQVSVDTVLPVTVPVDQTLTLPITQALPVRVSIDTAVPIAVDVPVRQSIRVDQVVEVDGQVATRVMGIPMTVPVKGRIPVKADVPIDVVIPVRHTVPVVLNTEATVRLREPLRAHVQAEIQTQVPIRESLSVPVMAPVQATLTFPQRRVQAGLDLMDVTVPFSDVSFAPRDGTAAAAWWARHVARPPVSSAGPASAPTPEPGGPSGPRP